MAKFIQLISTDSGLYALDEAGNVWVYMGFKHGWAQTNMNKMSSSEAKRACRQKFGSEYEESRRRDLDNERDSDWGCNPMRKPDHLVKAEKILKDTTRFIENTNKLDLEDLYGILDDLDGAKKEIKDRINELRGEGQ